MDIDNRSNGSYQRRGETAQQPRLAVPGSSVIRGMSQERMEELINPDYDNIS